MPEWLVRISGKEEHLAELARVISLPRISVVQINGEFYIKSSEFNAITKSADVLEKGRELVLYINGATKYALGWWHPITAKHVVRMNDYGSNKIYLLLHDTVHVSDSVTITAKNDGGVISTFHSADQIPEILDIASTNQNMAKALRLYGQGNLGFADLYKIHEVVRADMGDLAKLGWATKKAINLFTHTANNPQAIGDAACHGHSKNLPPKNPMLISVSRALVEKILRNCIK